MCWESCSKENAEIKTAESDIRAVKVVVAIRNENGKEAARPYYAGGVCSFYPDTFYRIDEKRGTRRQTKMYEKGGTYSPDGFGQPGWRQFKGVYAAERGFHSYSPECEMRIFEQYGIPGVKVHSGEGEWLDTFASWTAGGLRVSLRLMDCVIPEGSRYCVNERGEYVSDRIRVEGFRPLRETARKKGEG